MPLSYRYNKPVIAYSKKYVEAGALAAVFSSPDDVVAILAEQLQQNIHNATTDIDNNKFFSIAVNRSVGRSLRIQLQQPERYRQQLQAMEKSTP